MLLQQSVSLVYADIGGPSGWGFTMAHTDLMHDAARLHKLITEYGQLQKLSGPRKTAQARGIRFNNFIAEMLGCWGIDAEVSTATPGVGEIDVNFAIDGTRYLVEAKWEKTRADAGPLAKLEKRLTQRLRGTVGIFVSMAGYTPDGVGGLDKGSQLSMLLFDRTHVEAMLSGLVPPQELLNLALDRAAFRGHPYSSILDLLAPKQQTPPISFGCPPALAGGLITTGGEGMTVTGVLSVSDSNQLGIAVSAPSKLLITHQEGIVEADLGRGKAVWRVPVRGCHRNPVLGTDAAIMFARRHGVGQLIGEDLTIIGGGLSEASTLFTKSDGSVWAVDPADPIGDQGASAIVRLGANLGDQQRHLVTPQWNSAALAAAWLDDTRLALVHGNFCSVTELDTGVARGFSAGISNCVAVLALEADTVMTVGGSADIQLNNVVTGRRAELARLELRPSVFELAADANGKFYLASYFGPNAMDFAVVEIAVQSSTSTFIRESFGRADTGDVAGYLREVTTITNRVAPTSSLAEPELNRLYNEAQQQVADQLAKPIAAMIEAEGFQLVMHPLQRSLEGWPPPEFGGSASRPRWRAPDNQNGSWLEVSVGVSHRAWPEPNVNDLIITLIIATMSERAQHTVLTRFVPFEAGDPSLPSKIEQVLVDARALLPAAIKGSQGSATSQGS